MRGAWSRSVVVGLMLSVAALSGCTGSDEGPTTAPSVVESPIASPSPSPSPAASAPVKPERPAAMERDDAEGAAAAAKYFIELYPYVMATGDTEEFEAMSHRACGFCEQTLDDASRISELGRTYRGGDIAITILGRYERDPVTGIYPLDVEVTQEASETLNTDGSVVASAEPQKTEHRLEIGRRRGSWLIVAVAPRPGS